MDTTANEKLKALIVYICSLLPANQTSSLKINKLVWFIESEYYRRHAETITPAKFAAIDHGPVIDQYRDIFDQLEEDGYISVDKSGLRHVFVTKADTEVRDAFNDEQRLLIEQFVEGLGKLSNKTLELLSHKDAYYITLHENHGANGRIIDMELTLLESNPLVDIPEITEKETQEIHQIVRELDIETI